LAGKFFLVEGIALLKGPKKSLLAGKSCLVQRISPIKRRSIGLISG